MCDLRYTDAISYMSSWQTLVLFRSLYIFISCSQNFQKPSCCLLQWRWVFRFDLPFSWCSYRKERLKQCVGGEGESQSCALKVSALSLETSPHPCFPHCPFPRYAQTGSKSVPFLSTGWAVRWEMIQACATSAFCTQGNHQQKKLKVAERGAGLWNTEVVRNLLNSK